MYIHFSLIKVVKQKMVTEKENEKTECK